MSGIRAIRGFPPGWAGAGGRAVVSREAGSGPTYAGADGRRSVVVLTDGSGALTGSSRYDAFGVATSQSGSALPIGFGGAETDAETGFALVGGGQYYDPATATTLAPAGGRGATPIVDAVTNPLDPPPPAEPHGPPVGTCDPETCGHAYVCEPGDTPDPGPWEQWAKVSVGLTLDRPLPIVLNVFPGVQSTLDLSGCSANTPGTHPGQGGSGGGGASALDALSGPLAICFIIINRGNTCPRLRYAHADFQCGVGKGSTFEFVSTPGLFLVESVGRFVDSDVRHVRSREVDGRDVRGEGISEFSALLEEDGHAGSVWEGLDIWSRTKVRHLKISSVTCLS